MFLRSPRFAGVSRITSASGAYEVREAGVSRLTSASSAYEVREAGGYLV